MPRSTTQYDWTVRIDRVVDFITEHLDEELPLARLAKIAAFSPFHFHRIFHAHMGETVRAFVARRRVERAVLLLGRAASSRTLTDLALELGFVSSSEFSRAFHAHTGLAPSTFRRRKMSKNPQGRARVARYRDGHGSPLDVRIVSRPETRIASVSVTNSFAPGVLLAASQVLVGWRERVGLPPGPWWGLSSDDPFVTPAELCRYEVAIEIPAERRGAGRVHTRTVAPGLFAELDVRGEIGAIDRAWTRVFAEWLPGSGYEPENAAAIERFSSRPDFEHWAQFELTLSLRVRRS